MLGTNVFYVYFHFIHFYFHLRTRKDSNLRSELLFACPISSGVVSVTHTPIQIKNARLSEPPDVQLPPLKRSLWHFDILHFAVFICSSVEEKKMIALPRTIHTMRELRILNVLKNELLLGVVTESNCC